MFKVDFVVEDKENFPKNVVFEPLELMNKSKLEWFTPATIVYYFDERSAAKGHKQGRKLFLCDFLKNVTHHANDGDIYISGKCSAETKKNKDYRVAAHLNVSNRTICKAECECVAGKGPNAACKHVGALMYGLEHYAVTGTFSNFIVTTSSSKILFLGNVKQNETCTDLQQKWHKPSRAGRNLDKVSVDELVTSRKERLPFSVAVSNYWFNSLIQGILSYSVLCSFVCLIYLCEFVYLLAGATKTSTIPFFTH